MLGGRGARTQPMLMLLVSESIVVRDGVVPNIGLRHGAAVPYSFTHTFLTSVKNSSESKPPSRPMPLSFIPPNGTRRSRSSQQLIHTVPLSIAAATRCARCRSRVQTLADNPYRVE